MFSDFFGALQSLFDGNAHFNTEIPGYRFSFAHNRRGKLACLGTLDNFFQRRTSERANRIISDVSHQLHPHVMPNICANRTTQAGLNKSGGKHAAAFALRSIRFADCETCTFDVLNNAGLADDRRRINPAPNYSRGIDIPADLSTGIDRVKLSTFPLTAMTIEVPPGNPVLRADHTSLRPNQRRQPWGHRRQAVRLQR